jgi:hypothetical protein
MEKVKMLITRGGGFEIAVYARPTNSQKRSINWVENHFPLKRVVTYLVASRTRFGLSMAEIKAIKERLHNKEYSLHTWGNPGRVQIYVESRV